MLQHEICNLITAVDERRVCLRVCVCVFCMQEIVENADEKWDYITAAGEQGDRKLCPFLVFLCPSSVIKSNIETCV